jgi:hypothetical protein
MANTITIQDTGSTNTTGQGGQVIYAGAATAGSVVAQYVLGSGAYSVELSGTWTGTLSFEQSPDGVNWSAADVFIEGVDTVIQSATSNGIFQGIAAGNQQVRVRATAAMTGTTTVAYLGNVVTDLQHVVVLNASSITLGNIGGKAANGAAAVNNPVLVAGSDGTNARNLATDTSGRPTVVGAAASAAAKAGNPVQIGSVFNTTQPTVTTGQMVEAQATARGAAIIASGVDPIVVEEPRKIVQVNPTVTASSYSANNVVGGIQTLTGLMRGASTLGLLESVSVIDAAAQAAQLSIFFFKATPTGGTYTDHGALVLAAADLPNYLGKIDLTAATYDAMGTAVKSNTLANIGLELQGDSSGNVYAIATTTGTPTYTALCLTFTYGARQS